MTTHTGPVSTGPVYYVPMTDTQNDEAAAKAAAAKADQDAAELASLHVKTQAEADRLAAKKARR